jgi:hypothetical protein
LAGTHSPIHAADLPHNRQFDSEARDAGQWFYFAALEGPWRRIATLWLDDASLSAAELQTHLEPWAELAPVGGTTMDAQGNL